MRSPPILWLIPLGVALLPAVAHADLEVGFVLDTTGSMGNELREAKDRVKQLAEALARLRPNETLRFGVVAFRDEGDEYVTRVSKLSSNVDDSFRFLQTLLADGGGDGPEHVLAGVDAALDELGWDLSETVERQIFLIGDAPPHLDYPNAVTPEQIIDKARTKQIVINAVGCRSLQGSGVEFFRRLAYASEGRYQHIGGLQADQSSLADVLLDTLSKSEDAADRAEGARVLVTRLEPAQAEPREHSGLQVTAFKDSAVGCGLRVALPPGLALRAEPEVRFGKAAIHVTLDLVKGDGGLVQAILAQCPIHALPVQIELGGRS